MNLLPAPPESLKLLAVLAKRRAKNKAARLSRRANRR